MNRLLAALAALALSSAALAAPPALPVTGILADASGVLVDGDIDVTFTLYDDAGGTNALWTSSRTITATDGHFTAYLGSDVPLELEWFRDNPKMYLGVQVGTDPEMAPFELATSAYAAYAEYAGDAGTLDGSTLSEITDQIPLTSDIEAVAQDVCFDTVEELRAELDSIYEGAGSATSWNDLLDVPSDLLDGDDNTDTDTTYTAGSGLSLSGTEFALDEAALVTALGDDYLPVSYRPDWADLTGIPDDIADGDADTTYEAGDGLTLTDGTFAVDPERVSVAASYMQTIRVQSKGLSSAPGGRTVAINGATVQSTGRSWGLTVINRDDGTVALNKTYDIFGNAANATTMANDLAGLDSTHIIVVNTYDEPARNHTAGGLPAALYRCGASPAIIENTSWQYRSAYALVGVCDMGVGTGIELYAGDSSSDPTAFIDMTVLSVDGSIVR